MVLLSVYYYLKHLYIYVPQVYDDASHFPWIFYGRAHTVSWDSGATDLYLLGYFMDEVTQFLVHVLYMH